MLCVVSNGYGGLEHRNSTALICSRSDFEEGSVGYQTLLGLISHEYFHSWNVKRIKPQAFAPYRLQQENYTQLLWLFEGFTSYYDDLLALRAGVYTQTQYLEALSKTITMVHSAPGRMHQSVAQSSFYAWTKYYKQDENSPNSIISYYTKGSLVALCLDLTIRLKTKHQRSLDDVMRLLWKRFGRDFDHHGTGIPEHAFAQLVEEAVGLHLEQEIVEWTQTTMELPLEELLGEFGIQLTVGAMDTLEVLLGAKFRVTPLGLHLTQVRTGSSAEIAGLASGDTIIAANQMRVNEGQLAKALKKLLTATTSPLKTQAKRRSADPADPIRSAGVVIAGFRDDILFTSTLLVSPSVASKALLAINVRSTKAQRQAALRWLAVS